MKWEQRELGLALPGVISAIATDVPQGWAARVFRPKEDRICATEQDAKEWAETRMNEIKKEFILSLITKAGNDVYSFGNLVDIVGGYDGLDIWTVYHGDNATYKGTLEECKNYIVSCF